MAVEAATSTESTMRDIDQTAPENEQASRDNAAEAARLQFTELNRDYDTADAMLENGGEFVRCLAHAFFRADLTNRARLKAAFPEIWKKYSNL